MASQDNREGTIRYLMQMACEMKKMAAGADVPLLALLFEMAADEANDFLENHYAQVMSGRQPSGRCEGNETAIVADKTPC